MMLQFFKKENLEKSSEWQTGTKFVKKCWKMSKNPEKISKNIVLGYFNPKIVF